ncbi:sulfite exporter TauE/SafE family protein [Dactylosporangium sp. NBC_01737]|uniref:sulfite exporter TauE/SafE family protein n=1 Tax=Dactylosporangium sp. NBC_01737 TaxID=2975959 RepID=UPI002E1555B2|nr:sulfite exporter TauE/SafE family protein [Dactylosporangium sp. NBC_01737]
MSTTVGPVQIAFLVLAGILGGVVGTAGGIASLVTYPALLAAGLNPLQANVSNTVAVISGAVASSAASREELRVHRQRLPGWALVAVAGGTAGAVLLLVTPPGVFAWIVPFLIASAAVLVLVRPAVDKTSAPAAAAAGTAAAGSRSRLATGRPVATWRPVETWRMVVAAVALCAVCVYSGYFGAGAGILTLAIVLLLVDPDLVRANAVKNALTACAGVMPAVMFAVLADVAWWAVVPLAVGSGIGGALGPAVTRRLDPRVLRTAVAVMGFGLAAWLLVRAAG